MLVAFGRAVWTSSGGLGVTNCGFDKVPTRIGGTGTQEADAHRLFCLRPRDHRPRSRSAN